MDPPCKQEVFDVVLFAFEKQKKVKFSKNMLKCALNQIFSTVVLISYNVKLRGFIQNNFLN